MHNKEGENSRKTLKYSNLKFDAYLVEQGESWVTSPDDTVMSSDADSEYDLHNTSVFRVDRTAIGGLHRITKQSCYIGFVAIVYKNTINRMNVFSGYNNRQQYHLMDENVFVCINKIQDDYLHKQIYFYFINFNLC